MAALPSSAAPLDDRLGSDEENGTPSFLVMVFLWKEVCWLLRISVPKNESPMIQSDPLALHLSIRLMAKQLLTLLFTTLF
jgi:hypothetical protein